MKKIEEYSQNELIALYKRMEVYITTWWFKYVRTYKMKNDAKDEPIISGQLYKDDYGSPKDTRLFIGFRIENIANKIAELKEDGEDHQKETTKLEYEKIALEVTNECLYWFTGLYDQYREEYETTDSENLSVWADPDEIEYGLHMNDDLNIENGVAIDYQVYEFVWNTLQYLDSEQLSKLLHFADTGYKNKWQLVSVQLGRKSKVCEIRQIDIETSEVVQTFTTRAELMSKIGIKKSHLAQCIKTAKDNPDDMTKWKKWVGEDGRKFGFVESQ